MVNKNIHKLTWVGTVLNITQYSQLATDFLVCKNTVEFRWTEFLKGCG